MASCWGACAPRKGPTMPFILEHVLVSRQLQFQEGHGRAGEPSSVTSFHLSTRGTFQVLYPGSLRLILTASVRHSQRQSPPPSFDPPSLPPVIDGFPTGPRTPPPPQVRLPHNGVYSEEEDIALQLRIFDPDGVPFTRTEVTIADIKKYRDPRGMARSWSYTLEGQSAVYHLNADLDETVTNPHGTFDLRIAETVAVTSAGPLVSAQPISPGSQRFTFALDRVGTFFANVTQDVKETPTVSGSMRLFDPARKLVASTQNWILSCPITLAMLGPSDPTKQWTLAVESAAPPPGTRLTLEATVRGEGRISTHVLQPRIQQLLGNGKAIELTARNRNGLAEIMMTIHDVVTAETLDMHGVLDSALKAHGLDRVPVDEPFVLFAGSDEVNGLRIDVSALHITNVAVTVGRSQHFDSNMPAIRLTMAVSGVLWAKVDVPIPVVGGEQTVAHVTVPGGTFEIEVAFGVDDDGTPRLHVWVPDHPLHVVTESGDWGAAAGLDGVFEKKLNTQVTDAVKSLFADPALAPRILMTLFGAHLSHLPPSCENDDFLFTHIAASEPNRVVNLTYKPAIGRSVISDGNGHVTFEPPSLPDTWVADNLKSKIKHIVYVMMENRSYDHVLGYRAQAPISDSKDGLTPPIMDAVNRAADPGYPPNATTLPPMHPLRLSNFPLNHPEVSRRRTRIPKGVGHGLADVTQQLAAQIDGPDGRKLNAPGGFVANFSVNHLGGNPEDDKGTVPFDVLGYYESRDVVDANRPPNKVDDLPMYKFLADNFAYCDRYFCSHPGPTMPNRMYSLTGKPQADRIGTPILDNNHGDNFLLSRAETIYDVLERNGVSYRVYESFPSITMLRMFARHAGDDRNIKPLDQLEADVLANDLPSVTVIEPAMHHYPEDDDHPDADMWRGQSFIRRVYTTLRKNDDLWRNTLLVITYDEHGGLYDHVVPPIAEVFVPPSAVTHPDETGGRPHPSGNASSGDPQPAPPTHPHPHPDVPSFPINGTLNSADPAVQVRYGVRVPTFLVSPWIPADARSPITLDHCSVLKTILATFCGDMKPFLSERVAASHSFESFVTAASPRMDVGTPPEIESLPDDGTRRVLPGAEAQTRRDRPLYRKEMREGQVDFHDIMLRVAHMLGR